MANRRALIAKLFYVGVALYVISFFLTGMGNGNDVHSGWNCALVALFAWALPQGTNMDPRIAIGMRLSGFGGLINPLAIVYAVLRYGALRYGDAAPRVRRALAITVLACIPLTWLALYFICTGVAGDCPRIGHAVWIAGLLSMVLGEFLPIRPPSE
jgi:hypothetical protein